MDSFTLNKTRIDGFLIQCKTYFLKYITAMCECNGEFISYDKKVKGFNPAFAKRKHTEKNK